MLNAIIISFEQALGTGLGQYSLYFNESLFSHFGTTVLQFPEVADDILSASGDPRSLYLKASAESSFLALLLLLLLIFRCWQKAIKIRDTNTRFFMIVYLTLMSVSLISFRVMGISLFMANNCHNSFISGERIIKRFFKLICGERSVVT